MCHSKSQMNKFWYIFGGEHQLHDTNSWDSYYYSLVRGNQKLLFPAELPIERLMQEHDSKPQNPIIANVLYKSKILESWGRGIGTMVDECNVLACMLRNSILMVILCGSYSNTTGTVW